MCLFTLFLHNKDSLGKFYFIIILASMIFSLKNGYNEYPKKSNTLLSFEIKDTSKKNYYLVFLIN